MKINRSKILSFLIIPTIVVPTTFIVSCNNSNNNESNNNSGTNNNDNTVIQNQIAPLINVELDLDNILSIIDSNDNPSNDGSTNDKFKKITVGDIFTLNSNTIKIVLDEKIVEWNKKCEEQNKKSNRIDVELDYVELPTFPSGNNEINKLNVFLNVIAGRNGSQIIKKELSLDKINQSVDGNLNVFSNNNTNFLPNNNVWFSIYNKTKSQLSGISSNDTEEQIVNKLNNLTINNDEQILYACLEKKESNGVLLNLYTNNKRIDNATLDLLANGSDGKDKCVVLQMFFSFSDINSFGVDNE